MRDVDAGGVSSFERAKGKGGGSGKEWVVGSGWWVNVMGDATEHGAAFPFEAL
jgi:hypothetical protein